jgi:hypothetical protein
MSRVTLRASNPVEVEYFDHLYETVDLPESKAQEMRQLQAELEVAEEDAAAVPLLFKWFDLLLVPLDGGKTKPSTVLKAKYKAQELTPRGLFGLWIDVSAQIAEENKGPEGEAAENGRPT